MTPLALPLLLVAAAAVVLLVDLFVAPRRGLGWLTAGLLAALLAASFVLDTRGPAAYGAYLGTEWTTFFDRLFLVAGLLAVLGSMDHLARQAARRQGEYYLLLLFSLAGMLLLPGARDLVLLVVAFELMGIPLYVMAAYAKTDAPAVRGPRRSPAAEAALKLYLVGATSTAITLFGLSLVVGMAGTTRIAGVLAAGAPEPIAVVGLMLVLGGLAFKIGLVPFHMWVPDTYQGAPTPFVAFLSVAPKAGGVVTVIAIVGALGHAGPVLGVLAAASMIAGNLLALPQTDVRRLLGYSGVAQMGYVLVAVAAGGSEGLGMAAFYLAGYLFTNMGAFLVLHAVAGDEGGYGLADLAGLWRRSPWLAMALLVFLLSLAGIPFVVGFWAKMYVFLAAYRAGLFGLVVLGAVLAVVGLFYYMQVARAAYMKEPTDATAPRVGAPLRAAILICLVAVVGLGLYTRPLVEAAGTAGASALKEAADGTH